MRQTSIDALISVSDIRGKIKKRVFVALKEFGRKGATCDDLERELNLKHQTLSARVRELWQEGWISRTIWVKRTRSGRWATVYVTRSRRKRRHPRKRCAGCGQVLTSST